MVTYIPWSSTSCRTARSTSPEGPPTGAGWVSNSPVLNERVAAAFLDWLTETGRINIRGTGGGRDLTYPIGVSQLLGSWRNRPGTTAGSDLYLGDLTCLRRRRVCAPAWRTASPTG